MHFQRLRRKRQAANCAVPPAAGLSGRISLTMQPANQLLPLARHTTRRTTRRTTGWRRAQTLWLAAASLLAACGSSPPLPGGKLPRPVSAVETGRDGPGANPPPDLHQVPNANPRLEAVRSGGPNKPYAVLGQFYQPLSGDPPLFERGLASWYGRKFHGQGTATGETYDMYAMTAAHKTMPLPSYARVRNPANGREVVVRVNDRGPFHSDRVIDLSYTAALKLGLLAGVAPVEVERITYEAIRTGTWRAPAGEPSNALTALQLPTTAGWPVDDPIAEIARRSAATPIPTPAKPAGATAQAAPGFWLQLGAFGQRDGALGLQQKMALEAAWLSPLMAIFNERNLHRLQAGPYASRADATRAAERLREALSLLPTIVDRR